MFASLAPGNERATAAAWRQLGEIAFKQTGNDLEDAISVTPSGHAVRCLFEHGDGVRCGDRIFRQIEQRVIVFAIADGHYVAR